MTASERYESVDSLIADINGHGLGVCRSIFAPDTVERLHRRMIDLYALHDRHNSQNQGRDYGIDVIHFENLLDGPHESVVIEVFHEFIRSRGFRIFQRLIDGPVQFLMFACLVRSHRPGASRSHVPFHQDVTFMTNRFRSFNCWIPLVDCGVEAPGLEVLRRRMSDDVSERIDPNRDPTSLFRDLDLTASVSDIAEPCGGEAFVTPILSAGDGLIFDQLTIHRTQIGLENRRRRISLEIRGCAADVPLNEQQGKHRFTVSETDSGFLWNRNGEHLFAVTHL